MPCTAFHPKYSSQSIENAVPPPPNNSPQLIASYPPKLSHVPPRLPNPSCALKQIFLHLVNSPPWPRGHRQNDQSLSRDNHSQYQTHKLKARHYGIWFL